MMSPASNQTPTDNLSRIFRSYISLPTNMYNYIQNWRIDRRFPDQLLMLNILFCSNIEAYHIRYWHHFWHGQFFTIISQFDQNFSFQNKFWKTSTWEIKFREILNLPSIKSSNDKTVLLIFYLQILIHYGQIVIKMQ